MTFRFPGTFKFRVTCCPLGIHRWSGVFTNCLTGALKHPHARPAATAKRPYFQQTRLSTLCPPLHGTSEISLRDSNVPFGRGIIMLKTCHGGVTTPVVTLSNVYVIQVTHEHALLQSLRPALSQASGRSRVCGPHHPIFQPVYGWYRRVPL